MKTQTKKEVEKQNRMVQMHNYLEYIELQIEQLKHIQNCPKCLKRMLDIDKCIDKETDSIIQETVDVWDSENKK